jgi:hypothetical protein
MAYQFGGLTLANVGDIVTQTSVSTNFQTVLTNSPGPTPPTLSGGDTYRQGQTWYNTTTKVLNQWDGTAWVGIGGGTFESLTDVDVNATKVTLQSGIMWNAAAVQGGVTGQWVTNQIYDASPTGGASNDF